MNYPLLAALAAAGCGSEGMTQVFTGDHRSPAFAWHHDEPGGAAP